MFLDAIIHLLARNLPDDDDLSKKLALKGETFGFLLFFEPCRDEKSMIQHTFINTEIFIHTNQHTLSHQTYQS